MYVVIPLIKSVTEVKTIKSLMRTSNRKSDHIQLRACYGFRGGGLFFGIK